MKSTPVERVMTRKVITATLNDTLEDAIVLLHDFRVNALPVVDAAGKIAGIITRTDVLEAFIEALGVGEVGELRRRRRLEHVERRAVARRRLQARRAGTAG